MPINLSYQIGGTKLEKKLDLKIFKDLDNVSISDPLINKSETLKSLKSLKSDKNLKEVYISKDITIEKPLILEKEYKLIISPGVKINLEKEGLIVVKGPIIMKGEKSNRIEVNSANGGKGILVLNSSEPSYISNATFNGLKANTTSSTNITVEVQMHTLHERIVWVNTIYCVATCIPFDLLNNKSVLLQKNIDQHLVKSVYFCT